MIIKETRSGGIEEKQPGVYDAICVGLIDVGTKQDKFTEKDKHQVLIQFELLDQFYTDSNGEEQRSTHSQFYTLSVHEKSNLRKALRGWRGRDFTADELAGFELKNILSKPCKLVITHNENGKAIIDNVLKFEGEVEQPKEVRYFSFDDFNGHFPSWMSEGMIGMLKDCNEYINYSENNEAPKVNELEEEEIPF